MKGLKKLEESMSNEDDPQKRLELCRTFIKEKGNKDFLTVEWGKKFILRYDEEDS